MAPRMDQWYLVGDFGDGKTPGKGDTLQDLAAAAVGRCLGVAVDVSRVPDLSYLFTFDGDYLPVC